MKKKILISITSQFGYHTDTYMYCKYLNKTKYEIHYVGFEGNETSRSIEDVIVHTIPVVKNKILRYWKYITFINRLIRKEDFDVLFLVSCQGTILIRLCNLFRKTILDIRTGDVWLTKKKFSKYNFMVWVTSLLFKRITIISDSLAKVLNLNSKNYHILPLGGEQITLNEKKFDAIHLFYIGIIYGRNIYQTLEGVYIFKQRNSVIPIHYHIVGYSNPADEDKLRDNIDSFQLSENVTFHGRKNHEEAIDLFKQCNVGVVYIPVSYGFTVQPTTKLYEYLLAGMPVIATNTLENKLAMNPMAGVLIDDSPAAFAKGLEELWANRGNYNSVKIKEAYNESTWENIVKYNFEPFLEKIIHNS